MRDLLACCLLVCLLLWGAAESRPGAKSCFLQMEPSSGVMSVTPRSDVSFVCDASCLGPQSQGQLVWKNPRDIPVPSLGRHRVHSVGYNRWMVNRLVVRSAMPQDSGVYTCEIVHRGRPMRFPVTLHVEEDPTNPRNDDGPRRGDIYVEPEPDFGEIRPVREASDRRYRTRQTKKLGASSSSSSPPSSRASQSLIQQSPGPLPAGKNIKGGQEGAQRNVENPARDARWVVDSEKNRREDVEKSRVRRQAMSAQPNSAVSSSTAPAGQLDHFKSSTVPTSPSSAMPSSTTPTGPMYDHNLTTVANSPVRDAGPSSPSEEPSSPSNDSSTFGPTHPLSPSSSENGSSVNSSSTRGDSHFSSGSSTPGSTPTGKTGTGSPTPTLSPGSRITKGPTSHTSSSSTTSSSSSSTTTSSPISSTPSSSSHSISGGGQGHVSGSKTGDEDGETDFGRYGLLAFGLALAVIILLLVVLLLFFLLPRCCLQMGAWNVFGAKSKDDPEAIPQHGNNQDTNVILLGERPHKRLAPMTSATGLNGEFITPVDLDAHEGEEEEKKKNAEGEEEEGHKVKKAEGEEAKPKESYVSTFLIGRLSSSKGPEEDPAAGQVVAGNTAAMEDNVFAPASSTPVIAEKTEKEKKRSDGGSNSSSSDEDEDESQPSSSDTSKDPAVGATASSPGGDDPKSLNTEGGGGGGLMAEIHLQINPSGEVEVENAQTNV